MSAVLQAYTSTSEAGEIVVEHGYVTYNGKPLDNTLTRRIIKMREEGFPIEPMLNFMHNLMENPSNRSINELYTFLDVGQLPITPDGHFMAYKRITADFKDCRTQQIDNSVGQIVEMPRGMVDDESDRTCSHGLHACSLGYLRSFYGDKLIAVKINPRDVVSIPRDYDNSKLRCCRYEVMQELDMALVNDNRPQWNESVAEFGDNDEFADDDDLFNDEGDTEETLPAINTPVPPVANNRAGSAAIQDGTELY